MTDTKLRELLVVIDDHYGRARSLEERRADTQIYIRAFGTIPDEIVEKALRDAAIWDEVKDRLKKNALWRA